MVEQPIKEETLFIIKEIETDPTATQRVLAARLGFSVGKTNYLLKELAKKGIIKAKSFSHNSGKLRKINYMLTQRGFEEKMRLMVHFLKRKEVEYNSLKIEWEKMSRAETIGNGREGMHL